MRKLCLIVRFLHLAVCSGRQACSPRVLTVAFAITLGFVAVAPPALAQESSDENAAVEEVTEAEDGEDENDEKKSGTQAANEAAAPDYPLAVTATGNALFVVDLDLPGVWKVDQQRELFVEGSKLLRQPMNRPRCVVPHPQGGIIVGDSATREIYWIKSAGAEPQPLNNGFLGIPMALVVDPSGKQLYVGDAERRATFRLPIEGGQPELVARVNARGLAFDGEGNLWAVTPDDAAIQKIDVENKKAEAIITGRPYQYPNGLAWAGDHGFVTDGYGKAIWKFTPDGKTEKWHEGEPLVGPVGIAVTDTSVLVADPKQKQVYEFNRESKEATPRM